MHFTRVFRGAVYFICLYSILSKGGSAKVSILFFNPSLIRDQRNDGPQTFSVMMYYTPEFADTFKNTEDLETWLDELMAITNQGYANSGLDITITMFCHELATIHDNDNSNDILRDFAAMKGGLKALRNTADAAALLVKDMGGCGVAWGNTFSYGKTVSVTHKVRYLISSAIFLDAKHL